MAKYKVGDKVRVKDHGVDVGPGWVDSMNHMMGKIATISDISDMGYYRIEEEAYWWCDEMFEGLVESVDNSLESTGNEIIDLLMKKLDVKIDEEFEIELGCLSPYHFDKNGILINSCGDATKAWIAEMIYGEVEIKKIPKPKEMTMQELEKALGYPVKIVKEEG